MKRDDAVFILIIENVGLIVAGDYFIYLYFGFNFYFIKKINEIINNFIELILSLYKIIIDK